jgi:hypothetical protein
VASTRALNFIRNSATRRQYESRAAKADLAEPEWQEVEPIVDELLDRLPDELRLPMVMHYLDGLSQSDVAAALGVNQSTISRRLSNGVDALREALIDRGITYSLAPALAGALEKLVADKAPASLISALGKMAIAGPPSRLPSPRLPLTTGAMAVSGLLLAAVLVSLLVFMRPLGNGGNTTMTATTHPSSITLASVPALAWGRQQETTYIGALAAALEATGPKRDYVSLMGDSGLAFRTRWWRARGGPGWCPSSPIGEMPPWMDLATDSAGWKMRWFVHLDGKTDLSRYRNDIVASVDAGVPVLTYALKMDMSLIYGYESGGDVVLVRDYYAGEKETKLPLSQVKGLLGFLVDRRDPPSREQSIVRGLQQAVRDWHGADVDAVREAGEGSYHLGEKAYDVWIDDLQNAGKLPPAHRKKMFQPNWWAFSSLADARAAAAKYVRDAAATLPPDARPALLRAADLYDQGAKLAGSIFMTRDAFLGPWSGKSFDQWDDATRQREIEILTKLRELDGAAVREINEALSAVGSRP